MIEQVFTCTRKVSVNYYTAAFGAPFRTVVNEVVFTTAGSYGELKSLTMRDNLALSTSWPLPARRPAHAAPWHNRVAGRGSFECDRC
jgi:hypothetical protein